MGELAQSSFRKQRSCYPESITTGGAEFALSVTMDSRFLAMLGPGMTGGAL
jgi:hypothetical protein